MVAAPPYPFHRDAYKLDVQRVRGLVAALDLEVVTSLPSEKSQEDKKARKQEKNLRSLTLGQAPARVTIILSPWKLNSELNNLTDYFSEQCRVQCRFLGHPSPQEYWDKLVVAPGKLSNEEAREMIYMSTRMCNNFRVSVAITVLRMFGAKRWLDISAGWGDRLLSALLTDSVELYCGVDPNPCLHPVYKDMIKTFVAPRKRGKYVLIEGGFETAVLPAGKSFDLVFTSPPFFDLETYSDAPGNSMVAHPGGERQWLEGFLLPSLAKAHAALEPGGHMVLYMSESKGTKYMHRMRKVLDEMMQDCGSLYYKDNHTIREFFVWRKKANP